MIFTYSVGADNGECYAHTIFWAKHNVYSYGGIGHSTKAPNTHAFCNSKKIETLPCNRSFHSSILYQNNFAYIFGGKSNGYCNDVIEIDIAKLTQKTIPTSGTAPSKRYGHTAVEYNDKMYVYGGYDSDGFICDDLFALDLKTYAWSKCQVASKLPAVFHHTAQMYNNHMIVYGGQGNGKIQGKLFAIDLCTNSLVEYSTKNVPEARYGHISIINDHWLYAYGGCNSNEQFDSCQSINLQQWLANAHPEWFPYATRLSLRYPVFSASGKKNNKENFWYIHGGTQKVDKSKWKVHIPTIKDPESLPYVGDDVIHHILSYLPRSSLLTLILASKTLPFSVLAAHDFHWKSIFANYWSIYAKYFNNKQLDAPTCRLKLVAHSQKFNITGDVQLTANIAKMSFAPNAYSKYIGKKAIHKAFAQYKFGNDLTCKIFCHGASAAGKTCLCIRYASNTYPEDYVPTVFDNYNANVMLGNNLIVSAGLWDWSGGEDYDRLRPLSFPGTHVFLLLFPVTDSRYLDNIANTYIPEILHHQPNAFLLLVGTKCDLRTDAKQIQYMHERKRCFVSKSQAKFFAKQAHCTAYVETSSLTGENVKEAFDLAIKMSIMSPDQLYCNAKPKTKKKKDCSVM